MMLGQPDVSNQGRQRNQRNFFRMGNMIQSYSDSQTCVMHKQQAAPNHLIHARQRVQVPETYQQIQDIAGEKLTRGLTV